MRCLVRFVLLFFAAYFQKFLEDGKPAVGRGLCSLFYLYIQDNESGEITCQLFWPANWIGLPELAGMAVVMGLDSGCGSSRFRCTGLPRGIRWGYLAKWFDLK